MKNPWETGQIIDGIRIMTCDAEDRLSIVKSSDAGTLRDIIAYPQTQKVVRLAAERRLKKLESDRT